MERYPDQRIIEQLQSNDKKENEQIILYLHQRMNAQVARFILLNSGGPEDVDDIFQDGLIALYKLAKKGQMEKVANIEAYLYSICRNLWLKKLQREKREVELTEAEETIATEEVSLQSLLSAERQEALDSLMANMGDACRQILRLYYYDRLSMKEIAKQMGFSNDQVAKNKKSICLKKLRQTILNSPHFRSLLNNMP